MFSKRVEPDLTFQGTAADPRQDRLEFRSIEREACRQFVKRDRLIAQPDHARLEVRQVLQQLEVKAFGRPETSGLSL
jgi:hypothetical protein